MSKTLCTFTFIAFVLLNENFAKWLLAMHVGGLDVVAAFHDAYKYFTLSGYFFLSCFRLIPYALLILVVLSQTFKNNDAAKGIGWTGLFTISIYNLRGYWFVQHAYYTPEHVSSTNAISLAFIPIGAIPFGVIGGAIGYGFVRLYQSLKNYK